MLERLISPDRRRSLPGSRTHSSNGMFGCVSKPVRDGLRPFVYCAMQKNSCGISTRVSRLFSFTNTASCPAVALACMRYHWCCAKIHRSDKPKAGLP